MGLGILYVYILVPVDCMTVRVLKNFSLTLCVRSELSFVPSKTLQIEWIFLFLCSSNTVLIAVPLRYCWKILLWILNFYRCNKYSRYIHIDIVLFLDFIGLDRIYRCNKKYKIAKLIISTSTISNHTSYIFWNSFLKYCYNYKYFFISSL